MRARLRAALMLAGTSAGCAGLILGNSVVPAGADIAPQKVSLGGKTPTVVTIAKPTVPLIKQGLAFRVPATIDMRGGGDVTQQLNAFLASVPDGSTVTFPEDARYMIDDTLLLSGRNSLTIDGNGAEFFTKAIGYRERSHWKFNGGSNITLRNLVIRGANPAGGTAVEAANQALEAQHGVSIKGVNGFVLEGATITDTYGDFVYVGDSGNIWANAVTIRNSVMARSGRQGIAITAGQNVMIDHNSISEVRRSTFDLEPNSVRGGAVNVTITANQIGAGRLKVLASGGRGGRIDNIVFSNNTINREISIFVIAPAGSRRSGFHITGNTSTVTTNFAPINLTRVDGAVISGNTQVFGGKQVEDHPVVTLKESCASVGPNSFVGKVWITERDGYVCP